MNFTEKLQAKQAEVQLSKAVAAEKISTIKQQLLNPTSILDTSVDNASSILDLAPDSASSILDVEPDIDNVNDILDLGKDARRLKPKSPVVSREGNISKHADGRYSVITEEGKLVSGLSELGAKTFAGYNAEDIRARKAGAPTSFIGNKLNALAQTTVDIGAQAASAFTTDPANLQAIKEYSETIKSLTPVNRKEQVAAHAAFTTIAKNAGNWEAIKNAAFNDLDTFISQGIDSTPYMIAFTVGGPVAQTGILTTLALGKGNQAVEEFARVNGRRATPEEVNRIKMWSAVGTVLEKYGDMAAVGSVTGRAAWVRQVFNAVKKDTPANILGLAALRITGALAGEGLSGGLTSATEQMAAEGEITDSKAIAYDAFAEAAGTPGGLTTIAAGQGVYNTSQAIKRGAEKSFKQAFYDPIKAREERLQSDAPITLGETPAAAENLQRIQEIAEKLNDPDNLTNEEIETLNDEKNSLINGLKAPAPEDIANAFKQQLRDEIGQLKVEDTASQQPSKLNQIISKVKKTTPKDIKKSITDIKDKVQKISEAIKDTSLKEESVQLVTALSEKLESIDLNEEIDPKTAKQIRKEYNVLLKNVKIVNEKPGSSAEDEEEEDKVLTPEEVTTEILNVNSMDDAVAAGKQALKLAKQTLTGPQAKALVKVVSKLKNKEVVTEAPLGSLGNVISKKTSADIAQINSEGNTANDKFLKTATKVKELEKELDTVTKTLGQVDYEIYEGKSDRWKGLNTYLHELGQLPKEEKDPKIRATQAVVIKQQMRTHAQNLIDKLDAFETALTTPKKSKLVNVVTGERLDRESPDRAMVYTVQQISTEEYNTLRKNKYVNIINDNSKKLISTLQKEVAYANQVLDLIDQYDNTTFKQLEDQQLEQAEQLTQVQAQLQNIDKTIEANRATNEISQSQLDEIDKLVEDAGSVQAKPEQDGGLDTVEQLHEQLNTQAIGSPEYKATLAKLQKVSNEVFNASIPTESPNPTESPAPESKVTPTGSSTTITEPIAFDSEDDGSIPGEKLYTKEELESQGKKIPTPVGNKVGTKRSKKRTLSTESQSKQAVRNLFPELINENFEFREEEELTKHDDALVELAEVLEVSKEKLAEKLKSLPDAKNFIEASEKEFRNVVEKDQVKDATVNQESLLGLVGKSFKELVGFKKNKSIGIHTLPDSAFESIDTLTTALATLNISSSAADRLAHGYFIFNERYERSNYFKETDLAYAVRVPLSILYRDGKLPPQVVFGLMLGATNWVQQHPNNNVFTHDYQKSEFLYGNSQQLTLEEDRELNNLGHNYRISTNQIGADIIQLLAFKANEIENVNTSVYFENLKVALGLAALHIENTPIPNKNAPEITKLPQIRVVYKKGITASDGSKRKVAAQTDRKNKQILIDKAEVERTFKAKAWVASKVEGVKAFPRDAFKSLEEWTDFLIAHEQAHFTESNIRREEGASRENHANQLAYKIILQKRAQVVPSLIEIPKAYVWNFSYYDPTRRFNNKIEKATFDAWLANGSVQKRRNIDGTVEHILVKRLPGYEKAYNKPIATSYSDYKHFFVNESLLKSADSKDLEEGYNAIKEIVAVLKADIGTEEEFPSTSPITKVIKFIDNSFGEVPIYVEKVLRKLQSVQWNASDSLTIAAKLAENNLDALHALSEIIEFQEDKTHEVLAESLSSSNRTKENDWAHILKAYNLKHLAQGVYYRYKLQNQHRIMMQGNSNPQNSKITRYLLRAYDPVTYTSENINLFKLAVAFNMGYDIDKSRPEVGLANFEEILTNPQVQQAIKAIQNIDKDGQVDQLAALLPSIKNTFGGTTGILAGLTALSKYATIKPDKRTKLGYRIDTADSFESDIILEIDGISNGAAMNIMQFPMFKDEHGNDNLTKRLNQTGTYSTRNAQHDPTQQDLYKELGALIKKFSTFNHYKEYNNIPAADVNSENSIYDRKNNALENLFPDLVNSDLRSLVKYPFMIFMYGGGIRSITEGVVKKEIVRHLYEQLNAIQNKYTDMKDPIAKQQYLDTTVSEFAQNILDLGGFSKNIEFNNLIKAIKDGTSRTFYFNDQNIIEQVSKILMPRFDNGLGQMLGETDGPRKAVIAAGEVMHAVFEVHYKKAYTAALEGTGRKALTERERKQLVKDTLLDVLPQYKGPLARLNLSDQTFIDLSKSETSDKDTASTVEYQYIDPATNKKVPAQTTPRLSKFTAPGVSTLIRLIINLDSSILTTTLDKHPNVLPLHDAIMGDPVTLIGASKTYNQQYIDINRQYSIIELIQEQLNAVMNTLDTEELNTVSNWLKKNAHTNKFRRKTDPILGLNEIIKELDDQVELTLAARKKAYDNADKDGGFHSFQLFYPGMAKLENQEANFYSEQLENVNKTIEESGVVDESIEDVLLRELLSEKEETDLDNDINNLLSLDQIPRTNPSQPIEGDITRSSIHKLFKLFKNKSRKYYSNDADMNNHTSVLETLMSQLAEGTNFLERINLTTEQIDNLTHGQYDPIRRSIRISLSRRPPISVTGQSPQEVYVHELLHAFTHTALHDNPLIAHRVDRLYHQTKAELDARGGYKIFLGDIINPSVADVKLAKKQYDYIFNNPENEANKLDEFLAYAVTNQALVKYLSGTSLKLPVRNKKIWGKLLHAIDVVIEYVRKLLNHSQDKNSYQEMLGVVEHLIAIQSKHKQKANQLVNKTYDALDSADQKIKEFASRQTERLMSRTQPRTRVKRFFNAVVGIPSMVFSERPEVLEVNQLLMEKLDSTTRRIAKEVGGGLLTPQLIEQLLHAKVNISKERQEAERFTVHWFNDIWKSIDAKDPKNMSVDMREALTEVLLRTDLSSLLGVGLTHQKIVALLGNTALIRQQKRVLRRRLGLKSNHPAIIYANELGYHIVTGKTKLENAHMNAATIVNEYLPDGTDETVRVLDAYATLASLDHLQHINSRQLNSVKQLADREFAADRVSNGIIDFLDSHVIYKEKSRINLFKDNPAQMVKGYIVERIDNLTSIKTGNAADERLFKNRGFTEHIPLGKVPGLKQVHDTLYVTRNLPEVTDASGIMSTTNQRNMGTTLTEILSKDPDYMKADGSPDYKLINAAIKKIRKQQRIASKKLTENDKLRLRPVRDELGKISDYRVMLDNATKKELLRPDLEIQNVYAHMQSTYVDRKNTIKSDKETIKLLVHEQQDLYPNHKNLFTDILDPTSKYADRYRKLPREVREYMHKFAVDGKFMVREDVIHKVFGFKVFDLSQLKFLQSDRMASAKRFAGLFHYLVRQTVGYGKDRIVIAMPSVVFGNMFSNIYQLLMRKIPLTYIMSKTIEGIQEYDKYKKDTELQRQLQHTIAIKKKSGINLKKEEDELTRVKIRIEKNSIHRMSAAGLNSLIVEDINDAQVDGYFNRMRRTLKVGKYAKFTEKFPSKMGDIAAYAFMTKDSEPYQFSRQIVQLTDFLGRYVMIEHATKVKGQAFKPAMHEAINAFVLFDETLTPVLEALDAVGVTSFLSYYLRNQRASRQLLQASPTGVATSTLIQYASGIPTLGNVNASVFGGDTGPNIWQLDDLFDEATNVTGVKLAIDAIKQVFG